MVDALDLGDEYFANYTRPALYTAAHEVNKKNGGFLLHATSESEFEVRANMDEDNISNIASLYGLDEEELKSFLQREALKQAAEDDTKKDDSSDSEDDDSSSDDDDREPEEGHHGEPSEKKDDDSDSDKDKDKSDSDNKSSSRQAADFSEGDRVRFTDTGETGVVTQVGRGITVQLDKEFRDSDSFSAGLITTDSDLLEIISSRQSGVNPPATEENLHILQEKTGQRVWSRDSYHGGYEYHVETSNKQPLATIYDTFGPIIATISKTDEESEFDDFTVAADWVAEKLSRLASRQAQVDWEHRVDRHLGIDVWTKDDPDQGLYATIEGPDEDRLNPDKYVWRVEDVRQKTRGEGVDDSLEEAKEEAEYYLGEGQGTLFSSRQEIKQYLADNFGDVRVTFEQMKELCPSCAESMKRQGLKAIKLGQIENIPDQMLSGLCNKFGPDEEGFHSSCMNSSLGGYAQEIDNQEQFCAALKDYCMGTTEWRNNQSSRQSEIIEETADFIRSNLPRSFGVETTESPRGDIIYEIVRADSSGAGWSHFASILNESGIYTVLDIDDNIIADGYRDIEGAVAAALEYWEKYSRKGFVYYAAPQPNDSYEIGGYEFFIEDVYGEGDWLVSISDLVEDRYSNVHTDGYGWLEVENELATRFNESDAEARSIVEKLERQSGTRSSSRDSVRGDPFWMRAKYPGQCKSCGKPIERGDDVFFWPKGQKGKKVECEECGRESEAQFQGEVWDEEMYGRGFGSRGWAINADGHAEFEWYSLRDSKREAQENPEDDPFLQYAIDDLVSKGVDREKAKEIIYNTYERGVEGSSDSPLV